MGFKIQEAEDVRPFRKTLDAISGLGKNLEEIVNTGEHLQIGLTEEPVFKGIEPGKE